MAPDTVLFVLSKDALFKFPESEDKYVSFIQYWLSANDTKAVVTLSAWKEFEHHWNEELSGVSDEVKSPFFASMRGLITPYRTKYASEAGLKLNNEVESDKVDEKTIVKWHYATVRFLVTNDPTQYNSDTEFANILPKSILTPKEFYNKQEVENLSFVEAFLSDFRSGITNL